MIDYIIALEVVMFTIRLDNPIYDCWTFTMYLLLFYEKFEINKTHEQIDLEGILSTM